MFELFKNIFLSVFIIMLFFSPFLVFATETSSVKNQIFSRMDQTASLSSYKTDKKGDSALVALISSVIKILLSFLGLVFLLMLLYSGFEWMTADGKGEKVENAKKRIISSIIGLVIVLLSYTIASFVITKLTTTITNSSTSNLYLELIIK